MIGVLANVCRVFLPSFFLEISFMLESAVRLLSARIEISKVAFASGSSQHGNALLASAASN